MLRRLHAFLIEDEGTSTIEFLIIFPVVFAFVVSFFEAGWLMTRSMMLDRGLDLAVRDLRIGVASTESHADFKTRICNYAVIFRNNCEADLIVEMIPVASPTDLPDRNSVCADRVTRIDPVIRYDPGARSEIVFIRACFVTDMLVPGMGIALHLPKDPSGGFALVSYSAFVNEPE